MANVTAAVLAAYTAGSLGVSVNSQGFLLLYVLGAVKVLGDLGLVNPEQTFASKGTASLISAAVCSKTPYKDIMSALQMYWNGSQNPFLLVNSRQVLLRQAADQMLPADAHTLCSSKAFISTSTALAPRNSAGMQATSAASTPFNAKTVHSGANYHVAIGPAGAGTAAQGPPVYANREALLDAIVESTYSLAPAPRSLTAAGDEHRAAAAAAVAVAPTNPQVQLSLDSTGPAAAIGLAHVLGAAAGLTAPCPANVMFCVKITAVPPASAIGSSSSSSRAAKTDADVVHPTTSSSSSSSSSNYATSSTAASSTTKPMADSAVETTGSVLSDAELAGGAAAQHESGPVSVQLSATLIHGIGSSSSSSSSDGDSKEIKITVSSSTSSSSTSSTSTSTSSTNSQQAALAAVTAAAAAAAPSFSSSAADIYPGLSQPLALPRAQWLSYMVLPPSAKVAGYMHYLGRVDAYMWAKAMGLVSAAVAEQNKQLTELLMNKIASVDAVDALFKEFVDWPAQP